MSVDFTRYLAKQTCSVTGRPIDKPEYAMEVRDTYEKRIVVNVYDFMIALLCQDHFLIYGSVTDHLVHPVTKQYIPIKEIEKVCRFFNTTTKKVDALWRGYTFPQTPEGRIKRFAQDFLFPYSEKRRVFKAHTMLVWEKSRCVIL